MKKIVTFSNFMVLLGIMTILFYFIPAVNLSLVKTYSTNVNLFTATFGGGFGISVDAETLKSALLPNGGLITAFCLAIVGIILTFLKSKNRLANLFAFPFYLASGILTALTATLVKSVNIGAIHYGAYLGYKMVGGSITVCVFFFILAFFALIDFIATVAKPKQPQNPAY